MSDVISEDQISSRWIIDFEKQIVRGKHVLLYGNVHDQFLRRGMYATPMDFLMAYAQELGFDVILQYDPIDGLGFAREEMRRTFDELVRRRMQAGPGVSGDDAPAPVAAPAPAPRPANPLEPPPRRRPGEVAAQHGNANVQITLEEMFARLRFALGQNGVSVMAIINLADMLTSDANRFNADESRALMQLKKCTLEASLIQQGSLAGYRNTLIITAGQLNRVPEWLYRENPFLSIVQAARPNKEERGQFVLAFGRNFYQGDAVTDLKQVAEEFSNLTEGFQAWDLEALRRTSHAEQLSLEQHRRLIDVFKFGLQDDPWEQLNRGRVQEAEATLSRRVIGQPRAVQAVTTMLTSAKVGLGFQSSGGKSAQPKGVFFFVGPTGVGKTELAKALTDMIFDDEGALERFDMSEYTEEHSAEKLTGAPPGFVGYEDSGRLTKRVMEHPNSILLFDEIEKAHNKVFDKFLQILEDGRLTDGKGQTAYFNQTAIIFTSNEGATDLVRHLHKTDTELTYEEVSAYFQQSVRDFFQNKLGRAELLNRLGDNIIAFDILRQEYIPQINQKFLDQFSSAARGKYHIDIKYDNSIENFIVTCMAEIENRLMGGRRIKTLLQSFLVNPFNRWLFEQGAEEAGLRGQTLRIGLTPAGELEVHRA